MRSSCLSIFTDGVAIAIGVLADGAMYCDEPEVGQMLFEASRRIVAHHVGRIVCPTHTSLPVYS